MLPAYFSSSNLKRGLGLKNKTQIYDDYKRSQRKSFGSGFLRGKEEYMLTNLVE